MLTVGGLQGFVFYAAEQLARSPGPRARGGADATTGRSRSSRAKGPRSSRSRWTRKVSIPTHSSAELRSRSERAVVPVHDPDVPEPERADAVGRAPRAPRRDRARARARGSRGRPVRARPLRGRARDEPARARGRGARHVHVLVLEDGGARRPQRATSCCPRRTRRRSRSGPSRPTSRLRSCRRRSSRVRRPRPLRAEPRARLRGAAGASRRDARRARGARAGRHVVESSRRAGTSSGSTSTAPTPPLSRLRRSVKAWLSSREAGSSRDGSDGGAASARLAYSYETPERITEGVERIMRLLG